MRKVKKCFEIFSQPDGPVGKQNQPIYWVMFAGIEVWVLFFVCVGFWSFGVGIALRLFFWISDYVRKVFENFENLSQPAVPVRNPDRRSLGSFFSKNLLVLCIV